MPLSPNTLSKALTRILGPDALNYRFLVGVSGGIDSVVLFDLLSKVIPSDQMAVAHVDHSTRGEESDGDRLFVRELARDTKLFEKKLAPSESLSEEWLRNHRLAFFEQVAEAEGFDFVLLAHHLNDQLETFLMRLIRGTGVEGLAATRAKRDIFIRPLLEVSRAQIQEYASEQKLNFRHDSSNGESRFFRNQVRAELTPTLEKLSESFGGMPKFLERFNYLLGDLNELVEIQSVETEDLFRHLVTQTKFWLRVSAEDFLALSDRKRAQLLRRIYRKLGRDTVSRPELKEMVKYMEEKQTSFSAPFEIQISYSCGYFYIQGPDERMHQESDFQFKYTLNQVRCEALGLELEVEQRLLEEYEFRSFRPGDRLGAKKLKSLWLESRIPRLERRLLPVMAKKNSSEVLWFLSRSHEGIRVRATRLPLIALQ